ncbi:hypothetical protein PAEVO_43400 [Paenibacillus sp. GM2FR]|nr:hypothetical protein PAEVO_43400 [Paenibacillus sp. GM2FR]
MIKQSSTERYGQIQQIDIIKFYQFGGWICIEIREIQRRKNGTGSLHIMAGNVIIHIFTGV